MRGSSKAGTVNQMTEAKRSLEAMHPGAVAPNKLAHFVVRTNDLAASRHWYLTVLAGQVAFENAMCCFLTYDDEHHRVGLIKMGDLEAPQAHTVGVDHIAFTFSELSELLATYKRLERADIRPYWCIIHGPTVSMYYRDPQGVAVELQYDVFRTTAEVEAFFAAGNYEENFIGVVFEPGEMIARFENGEPLSEIVKRPRLPPGVTPFDMIRT